MDWELVLTKNSFTDICHRLMNDPGGVCISPAGLARLRDVQIALVSRLEGPLPNDVRVVTLAATSESGLLARLRDVLQRPPATTPAVFLALGLADAAGLCAGGALGWSGPEPLRTVRVVAEGLPVANLLPNVRRESPDAVSTEVWSRSIGALSERVWERLARLVPTVFGCGRTGSMLAGALTRSGVRHLRLVDADRLQLGNLGEMELVAVSDVSRNKAEVLAETLNTESFHAHVAHAVPVSATSLAALFAAKDADILITCVDNPAARLTVGFLAQLYLKPMLDIGTGILESSPQGRQMGADVRLILPGRCPACFGGLRVGEAVAAIDDPTLIETDWRRQRLGSLRSLNMVAVGVALRLIEDFLSGAVRESTWLNLNYNVAVPRVNTPNSLPVGTCPVCSLAGTGDAGLAEVQGLLERLRRNNHLAEVSAT
jgi:tRNA A37 threonylcarbamoyladenosine dehydratase